MPNMTYCQFRNTLIDLQDCVESFNGLDALTLEERSAAISLYDMCQIYADAIGNDLNRLSEDDDPDRYKSEESEREL